MSQFDRPPQAPPTPKYTPEKLAEYLRDTDGALFTSTKVLVRGFEDSPGVYKPWPKAEVQKSLTSLLALFEVKIKYYQGAGESEKAKNAEEKVAELKGIFSEIDNSEEVPEGFLLRVKEAVESDINLPENVQNVLDGTEQSTPQEKRSTHESSKEKMDAIANLIDDLIQAYAKVLRSKVEANLGQDEKIKLLIPIIANLEKTQTAFLDAFNELGALELDEKTLGGIIKATTDTGRKLEQLNF